MKILTIAVIENVRFVSDAVCDLLLQIGGRSALQAGSGVGLRGRLPMDFGLGHIELHDAMQKTFVKDAAINCWNRWFENVRAGSAILGQPNMVALSDDGQLVLCASQRQSQPLIARQHGAQSRFGVKHGAFGRSICVCRPPVKVLQKNSRVARSSKDSTLKGRDCESGKLKVAI